MQNLQLSVSPLTLPASCPPRGNAAPPPPLRHPLLHFCPSFPPSRCSRACFFKSLSSPLKVALACGATKMSGKEKRPSRPPQPPTPPPPPPPHSIFSYVNSHFPPEQTHFPRLRPATLHTAPPTFFFFFLIIHVSFPNATWLPRGEMKSTRRLPVCVTMIELRSSLSAAPQSHQVEARPRRTTPAAIGSITGKRVSLPRQ